MYLLNRVFFLIKILLINFMISTANAGIETNDFSGVWCWELSDSEGAFSVGIYKDEGRYKGYCISTTEAGNSVEYDTEGLNFKVTEKKLITTKLKIFGTKKTALVQLSLLDNKKMKWHVLKYPNGATTVPREAMLYLCRGKVPQELR